LEALVDFLCEAVAANQENDADYQEKMKYI